MKASGRANILGSYVDLYTMRQAVEQIGNFLQEGEPAQIITLNAEIAYQARHNETLREVINSAQMVTADGIGTVWAARQLGYPIIERVTGIDLIYVLCESAAQRGWPIYLLGASPGVAEAAAAQLIKSYPGLIIAGTYHGYFTDQEIPDLIGQIKLTKAAVLLAALGAPKQEYFISQYQKQMQIPVCIGVGGSFDVIAGNKKRAPKIFIKLNLEWLYRLAAEPSRFKRQLVLPKFAMAVLAQRFRKRVQ